MNAPALVAAVLTVASAAPAAAQPPALGVFPPNATRVTARVLAQRVYAPGALPENRVTPAGVTLYALTLEIATAEPARADRGMGPAAGTIEAFSRDPLPPALDGRRVEAVLTLTGDTRTSRWFVSDLRVLPD